MKCPTCGFELEDHVNICPNCGKAVGSSPEGTEGAPEAAETAEEPVVSSLPGEDEGDLPPEKPKKMKKWPIVLLIVLAAAALATWLGIRYYNEHYVVHEIHLAEKSLDMIVGDTAQLTHEILPETAKNKSVTWESSNDQVASVSEAGLVTAVGSGQCEITVTTNNGFTDVCQVGVKDLVDIQKEAVTSVVSFIRSNSPEDENGVTIAKIRDIDDEHTFALGTLGSDLVLCYRDAVSVDSVDVDVKYTTYLNLGYGNIETADIVQDNQVEIFGYPVITTMRSNIALADYQRGAVVPIESLESNLSEMAVNDKIQSMFNNGVKGCFEEFRTFLDYHPELNCTIEDFGFTAKGDAPVPEEPEMTADSSVESMAESIAEQALSRPDSSVTIVEEIAEPERTDSAVSAAEAVPAPAESVIEMPAVPVVPAVPEAAESVPAESEAVIVENPVIPAPVLTESMAPESEAEVPAAPAAAAPLPAESEAPAVEEAIVPAVPVTDEPAAESEVSEAFPVEAPVIAAAESAAELWSAAETTEEVVPIIAADVESVMEEAESRVEPVLAGMIDQAESIIEEAEETLSEAESIVESAVEAIPEISDGPTSVFEKSGNEAAAESEAERKFKAITESLGGTMSMPLVPPAQIMC